MNYEFKKHIVFGTFFSLSLLVGSFQAAPDARTLSRFDKLGVVAKSASASTVHVLKDTLPGQVALAAVAASAVEGLVGSVVKNKVAANCPQGVAVKFESADDRKQCTLRVGYFGLGLDVQQLRDGQSDDCGKVSTSFLEKVRSARLKVDGVTVPNVLKTGVVLVLAKLVSSRYSK